MLVAVLVALCDELIMCSSNGIAHMYQPAFGHLLAMPVFILGKVQIFHGLLGQARIIKLRALVLPKEGQGLVLCRLGSGHFRFVNIRRVSGS